jgi:hypothetical protein
VNKRFERLALDAGLLNYVDNETPRRCFIDGHADLDEVQKFAELIVLECADWLSHREFASPEALKQHFGF